MEKTYNIESGAQPTFTLRRKIGHTTYDVNAYCLPDATDTFQEKLLRIIRTAGLDNLFRRGIMDTPQMDCQSGRSA